MKPTEVEVPGRIFKHEQYALVLPVQIEYADIPAAVQVQRGIAQLRPVRRDPQVEMLIKTASDDLDLAVQIDRGDLVEPPVSRYEKNFIAGRRPLIRTGVDTVRRRQTLFGSAVFQIE